MLYCCGQIPVDACQEAYTDHVSHALQIIRGGFSLMLRHRLHCKIERAETDMYLTGLPLLRFAMLLLSCQKMVSSSKVVNL